MRPIIVCVFLTLLACPGLALCEEYTYRNYAFEKEFISRVNDTMLTQSGGWADQEPFPPVSPRTVLASAKAEADRLVGKMPGYERQLIGVCLKPLGASWVWSVSFEWHRKPATLETGQPHGLAIVILMNGEVVPQKIRRVVNDNEVE